MELSVKQEAVLALKERILYKLRKVFHKFDGARYSFRNKLKEPPNIYSPDLFAKRVQPYVFVGLELRENSFKPNVVDFIKALVPVLDSFEFNDLIDNSPNSYRAVLSKNNITAILTLVHDKGLVMASYIEVFSEDIYD